MRTVLVFTQATVLRVSFSSLKVLLLDLQAFVGLSDRQIATCALTPVKMLMPQAMCTESASGAIDPGGGPTLGVQ